VLEFNVRIYHEFGNYMIGDSFLLGEECYFYQEIECHTKLWKVWPYSPASFRQYCCHTRCETRAVFHSLFSVLWKETPVVASCIILMPIDVTINIPRGVTLGCVTTHYTLFTGLSLTYQSKQTGSLQLAVKQYVLSHGLPIMCPVS
jgi:hypothetical protein